MAKRWKAGRPGSSLTIRLTNVCAGWVGFAGVLLSASASVGQTASPKRRQVESTVKSQTSDSLRFANGLLRQKKFDLAAQEYERILKAGASRDGTG